MLTAVVSVAAAAVMSTMKVVNVTEPMLPAASVTLITQLAYVASARLVPEPSESKVRVVALEAAIEEAVALPKVQVAYERSPASPDVMTTSGVWSFVGVLTAVVSETTGSAVSKVAKVTA